MRMACRDGSCRKSSQKVLVLQDATASHVAKESLRLSQGRAIFARAEFFSDVGRRREGQCLTAAHATKGGVLLLAMPLLPQDSTPREQKYIYANANGKNFTFSLPLYFAMEHREIYNILEGALGFHFDLVGGGRLSFEAGCMPRAHGMSGNFDLHDTNFEANTAISEFVSSFGKKFAAFCSKSGFPGVGALIYGSG